MNLSEIYIYLLKAAGGRGQVSDQFDWAQPKADHEFIQLNSSRCCKTVIRTFDEIEG